MSDWLENLEKKRLERTKDFTIDTIPSSYQEIDKALGVKGWPCGKIIEIAGHAGVGKTALILDAVAQAQEKGLQVVYLDLDCKFDKQFAMDRAVKCEDLLIFRPDPENLKNLSLALNQLIKQNLVDVIVFDTISQLGEGMAFVLQELSRDIAGTQITVFLASQIRNNFEDPRDYNTPFMKILNQYSNIRVMLKKIEGLKFGSIFIGKHVSVDIYKNALSHPKSTEIEIYI